MRRTLHPGGRRAGGFTLIELMIVVAIIAVVASIAIPNLISARVSANEASAVANLRTIATAQAQCQAAARVDVDSDGSGEFGMLRELSGQAGVRQDATGATLGPRIVPPLLSSQFGLLNSDGEAERSGFHFKVFLPGAGSEALSEVDLTAIESSGPAAIDTELAETTWCVYAWPARGPFTGHHTFFVNERGDVTRSEQDAALRSGPNGIEVTEAGFAFEQGTGAANVMSGPLAFGVLGRDGNLWTRVN